MKYDPNCLMPDYDLKAPTYITVAGVSYFRFSGKIGVVHLHGSSGSLCDKPSLSSNYAMYKPTDEKYICPACLDIAKGRVQKRVV